VTDKTAQDLLWVYAQRRRVVDSEFSDDLEHRLIQVGYVPAPHSSHVFTHDPSPGAYPHVCATTIDADTHREYGHIAAELVEARAALADMRDRARAGWSNALVLAIGCGAEEVERAANKAIGKLRDDAKSTNAPDWRPPSSVPVGAQFETPTGQRGVVCMPEGTGERMRVAWFGSGLVSYPPHNLRVKSVRA
jgi:hypothetical protein